MSQVPDINEISEQIMKSFMSIAKGATLYPNTHPAVVNPLITVSDMIRELHEERESVEFGIINGLLFFEDFIFYDESPVIKQFVSQLEGKKLSSVSILKGFENNDLFEILKLLTLHDPSLTEAGVIRDKLIDEGISKVTIKYVEEEEESIEERAKKAYFEAVDVVKSTFNEVRMGRIPRVDKTKKVIKNIVDIVFTDHNAMLCLTMIKAYDDYTFNHSVNVSVLAVAIAKALNTNESMVNEIGVAGLLHDIGKTKTEISIIKKPGKLTEEEFAVIKQHPVNGYEILKQMEGVNKNILDIVHQHHVHYDKKGYPNFGVEQELNPYCTLITTADTYDAITTLRSYQTPRTPKDAIDIMLRFENNFFETRVLRKFIEILGIHPTGSFVRLDTNEIALVTKQNPDDTSSPIVKIVIDSDGKKVTDIVETDLREKDETGSKKLRSIVSAVDTTFMGLDVKDYI
jgi:putative nucleotidyltransferase with HDIG domain